VALLLLLLHTLVTLLFQSTSRFVSESLGLLLPDGIPPMRAGLIACPSLCAPSTREKTHISESV